MKRLFVLLLVITGVFFVFLNPTSEEDSSLPIIQAEEIVSENGLHPVVEVKKQELIQLAEEKGIHVINTDGHRSEEKQDELFAQGRSQEGSVVTQAEGGESYHNYGLAIDFALKDHHGQVIWDIEYDGNGNGKSDWFEVAEIAEELGFEWGGRWSHFQDYPHLQMDFGYTLSELQAAKQNVE